MTEPEIETIDAAPGDALVELWLYDDGSEETLRRAVFRWRFADCESEALTALGWLDATREEVRSDCAHVRLMERGGRLFGGDGYEETPAEEFDRLRRLLAERRATQRPTVSATAREAAQ